MEHVQRQSNGSGNNAISCLRKDPYAYGKKIGLSYKQEELLCKHFSHSANTSCRLRACSEKASDNVSTSGHIWTDMRVYYQEVKQLLNNHIFDEDIALSTCMPFIQKQMLLDTQNGRFYDRSLLIAEQRLPEICCALRWQETGKWNHFVENW